MRCFNKDTVSCKLEIYSKDSLLSNVSDAFSAALLPAVKFAITGEKGGARKSLILLLFL